jgi:hypothetical protein
MPHTPGRIDSGTLGKYICHHNYRGWINGKIDGFEDGYTYGRNPTDAIIANYRKTDWSIDEWWKAMETSIAFGKFALDNLDKPEN